MRSWLTNKISVCLLICAGGFISDAHAAEGWLKVQSRHFALIGNGTETQMRGIATGLEDFLPVLASQVPGARGQTEGFTVVVFNDDASYEPFKPQQDGATTNAAGYFLAGRDLSFIAIAPGSQTQRILYHELFHALSRQESKDPLPPWAGEGLAEFYSTFDTSIGSVIPSHVGTLQLRTWIPLEDLLAASRGSSIHNDSERLETFYAQSWALIHYLIAGNDGMRRRQLPQYLALRSSGKSVAESVHEAFHADIAELDLELRKYVTVLLTNFKIPLPRKLDLNTPMQVSAMTDSESTTYFGDLLLQLNRLDAAEAQFQRALQMEPGFTGTVTAMGRLRMQQNMNMEALSFLQRAIETDSRNYLAHFHFAAVVQTLLSNAEPAERKSRLDLSRKHLKKTIELAPWFLEAYRWLGSTAIASQDGYEEAEAALSKAIELDSGREELRSTLSEVKEAFAAHLEAERLSKERESRKRLAEAFDRLRVASPPVSIGEYVAVWTPPPALPSKRRVQYPTFDGILTAIECRDGLTLVLRSPGGFVKFHTKTPIKLEFTSKVSNAANEAACGAVRPEQHVVVTYRRGTNASFLGEPLRIEYK